MPTPLNILIVEDSPDDVSLLLHELWAADFTPTWKRVHTEAAFREALRSPLDIVFSDYTLPQFSVARALEVLGELQLYIPFILVSGTIGEERMVESLKLGVTDYVPKDRPARLGSAVRRALAESAERLQRARVEQQLLLQSKALEAADNGILITDVRGQILAANPKFCAMTGYTMEEVLGATPRLIRSGQHDKAFYHHLWTTILAGNVWCGEIVNRRKDGSLYSEESTITPVRTGGAVTHFIAVKQDITERKEMQRELRRRDERLNSFFSNATAGLAILDPEMRFVQVNETLAAMHGIPAAEHLGKSFRELLPTLAPVLEPLLREVMATSKPRMNVELSGRLSELGTTRHWMGSYFPVASENGQCSALGYVLVEISATKIAQEQLKESEEQFRQFAETIDEVFWMIDPRQNQILYVSPAFEQIWGRSAAGLTRDKWLEFVHPEDRDRVRQSVTSDITSRQDRMYRIVRPDGQDRWIHDRAFPVRDDAGQVHRIVGVAEDVTEQKALEQQFRQAQKMESIGQLAGGVAHDFNNILTIIQGHASLIEMRSNLEPAIAESVHEIAFAAEHAATLTRQLLTFSRRQVIQPGPLDLNDVISGVTKMLRRVLGEDIVLRFEPAPHLPLIHADAGMMEQILMNVAVNARDAMPRGGTLFVRTGKVTIDEGAADRNPEAVPGEFVCLTVTDNGCGIPPEHLPKIFEPFFTTKEVGKGTGLGLATVYGIVKQHQGWINVQSVVARGTTFTIVFPAREKSTVARKSRVSQEKIRGGKETILLVEDEHALCLLVRGVLESYGYTVLEANSGPAALDVWAEHRRGIDLLLTDLVMPGGMSGRDLAEQLRRDSPRLRVIFMSGYSPETLGKELQLVEGLNFLQKPYTPRKLARCVRECLEHESVT